MSNLATNKLKGLLLGLLCFSYPLYAQQNQPDTLEINTKSGKIILISDSLQKFRSQNANDLINKALIQALSLDERRERAKIWRDTIYYKKIKNKFPIRPLPVLGLGLLRDKASPFLGLSLDFAPQRQDYYYKGSGEYTFINLAVASYFSFEKKPGSSYRTLHDVFLEGTLGNRINNIHDYGRFSEVSGGLGFLIKGSNRYFNRNTFKLFVNFGLKNSFVRLRPELYFDDGFRNIFPGLTLKLF